MAQINFFNGLLRYKLQSIKFTNCECPIQWLLGNAELGERLHTSVLARSRYPRRSRLPVHSAQPQPSSGEHTLLFVSMGLLFLDGSCKWNLGIRGLP